jgi:hypothetical protein
MSAESDITIVKGNILLFFCYEVAYSIRMEKLEADLKQQETAGAISLQRSKSHYLRFENMPLLVKLGSAPVVLGEKETAVGVQARVFDFGVVSLCLKLPFSGSFPELVRQSALLSRTDAFFELSRSYLGKIGELIAPALNNPTDSSLVEDYFIFQVSELSRPWSGEELLKERGREIAMILRAEEQPLSAQEIQRTLAPDISYYPSDILVIDWDRAFLYDKEENTDHIDIIEFANTQLLDMRYFDGWLDRELERLYLEMKAERFAPPLLRVARFRRLSKRVLLLMTDVMFLTDQIDNSLRAIDTLYAARVHRAIAQKLYLDEWKSGLNKKLTALRDISSNLNMQIYNLRSMLLEATIVVLIVLEIILGLIRH